MMQAFLAVFWALLYVIGLLLAGLITLVFVILLIPFGFEVQATKGAETRVVSRLLIANIGLYSFTVWPPRDSKGRTKKPKKDRKRREGHGAGRTASAKRAISTLSMDLVPQIIKLIRRLWSSLRLRIRASGRFGASDPATTGMIFGAYEAVARPFNIPRVVQPCFDRACLEGRVEVKGRIWPIELVVDAALFIFSKPVRQIWFPELKYLVSRR